MSHDLLIAVDVADAASYEAYRTAIAPIMAREGATFRHDVEVAETVTPGGDVPMSRLFVISFPDRAARDAMFGDPAYVQIRDAHFPTALKSINILAVYTPEDI